MDPYSLLLSMEFQRGQTSLINWLKATGQHTDTLRDSIHYDNQKTERLETLHRILDLPINTTHYLDGATFDLNSPDIQKIIQQRGGANTTHAFRIAPKPSQAGAFAITKKYGVTFAEVAAWLRAESGIAVEQADIRVTDYRGELKYAAVVVVGAAGVIGEVVRGSLYELTYAQAAGDDSGEPSRRAHFFVDFADGANSGVRLVGGDDAELRTLTEKIMQHLRVADMETLEKLRTLEFPVYAGYAGGYYEYIENTAGAAAFTDMNLKKITNNLDIAAAIKQMKLTSLSSHVSNSTPGASTPPLRGLLAYQPRHDITGTVQIIDDTNLSSFQSGNILVCRVTHVDYLPLMQKALAIVTDQGGITSHPAIIARELRVPCVVGTRRATATLKNGNRITINAQTGVISVLVPTSQASAESSHPAALPQPRPTHTPSS